MNQKQKIKLRKLVNELASIRGRHTELVSVYVPSGYDIIKVIQHLEQEKGTASNIKDARTRKNVIDSLERAIRHLRLYKKTPENGLAVFAGDASDNESKIDIKVWSIEPPEPIKTRLYRCDQTFVIDILKEMLEAKDNYGLVVLDAREATLGLLKGSLVQELVTLTSGVPGKVKAGGQCHPFGTLVQSSTGDLIKIEKTHNPIILKSMNSDYSIEDSPITDKWNTKKNVVYKIVTKSPRMEVESSKDHIFFVLDNGKINKRSAEELKKGDILLTPERIDIKGKIQSLESKKYYNSFTISKKGRELLRKKRQSKNLYQKELAKKVGFAHQASISDYEVGKQNITSSFLQIVCKKLNIDFNDFLIKYTEPYKYRNIILPTRLDESFAQFLGYYLGDGSMELDRITLFEQNRQVASYYKNKFSKYLNVDIKYKFREDKNYHQLRLTSRPLVRLIKNEFPEIKKALDSEIPKKILESPNRILASFLRGLFDAEGYVHNKRGVCLGTNNKKLAQQIQPTLLRFSIINSIQEYDNRANKYSKNHRYTIDITEKESIELFKQFIGFSSSEKIKKLNNLINIKSDVSNVRQILTSGKEIRKIIEKRGYNLEMFPKVSNFFYDGRMMGKRTFKSSILSYIKDKKLYKELNKIYEYPILPVKINKIEKIDKRIEMVDISVKNQNFIANGIIVHNSAARYSRLREGALKEFFQRIGEAMNNNFLEMKDLRGIIIGGPIPTKDEFFDSKYINNELKRRVIGLKDLSYTGEFGLQELVDKAQDLLMQDESAKEKAILVRFFETMGKNRRLVAYGKKEVEKVLELGAVDTLILCENLDDKDIEEFEERASNMGTEVYIVSIDSREGKQLRDLGGMGAILRYPVE